jgi:phosphoribosyl 1,2-cyclic phosphodiesterase
LKLHVLASGSSGNSTLVEAGETRILVDCGLSGAEAVRRLGTVGCRPEEIRAIVVSHEHTDHVQGVGVLARRFAIPVYLTEGTGAACNGQIDRGVETTAIEAGREFEIEDLRVRPFSIPHDAADPVGFTFRFGEVKAGLATDIGFSTALVRQHLSACNLLVLESNHDPDMLARSSYPWELKRRIRGKQGHLSNDEAGQLLERILHDGLEEVALAHLSERNNHPDLALRSAQRVLESRRLAERVRLTVAAQGGVLTVMAGRALHAGSATGPSPPPTTVPKVTSP